ncbi:MAG: heavy metal-responsive transcriptional regulator [Candidatus Rokuibacteriota bacterium]
MNAHLKIGELARQAGATRKAIRFYEAAGVLPPPGRGANGYRLYTGDAVDVLRFVKQAAGLGLTLAEVKEIIAIRQGRRPPCRHVHHLLKKKADELDRKLKDLLELRRRVHQSLAAWKRAPSGKAAVCPHIESRPVDERRRVVATRKRRRPDATD